MTNPLPARRQQFKKTANGRLAASLDAMGVFSRKEIAERVGVNETTVSQWRMQDWWDAEVTEWQRTYQAEIEPLIHAAKIRWLESGEQARRTLASHLDAQLENGTPNYTVQREAAKVILQSAGFEAMFKHVGDTGAVAAAAAVVKIYVSDEAASRIEAEDAIDGHAEEVDD